MLQNEDTTDSDYEEEESLVLVELSDIIESELLSQVQDCNVLGIDTDKPLLQISNYIFQGEYEDPMGTCMLFEDKSQPEPAEEGEGPTKEIEYKCLTNKKLCMQRVFFKKPEEKHVEPSSTSGSKEPEAAESSSHIAPSTSQSTTSTTVSQDIPDNDDTVSVPKIDTTQTGSSNLSLNSSTTGYSDGKLTQSVTSSNVSQELQNERISEPLTDTSQLDTHTVTGSVSQSDNSEPQSSSTSDIISVTVYTCDSEGVSDMETEQVASLEQSFLSHTDSQDSEIQGDQKSINNANNAGSSDPPNG